MRPRPSSTVLRAHLGRVGGEHRAHAELAEHGGDPLDRYAGGVQLVEDGGHAALLVGGAGGAVEPPAALVVDVLGHVGQQ